MNLQHLRYAVEIANFGSISRAAQALYVSQPYLSKIIRELEEEYGITIFARSKNGITPTDSGRLFLDMARDLLDNAKNFESVFQELKEDYRLRISSSTNSHFIDALIRMVNSLPSDLPLRFSYRETSNQEVLDDVYNSRCDIGTVILNHGNIQEFSDPCEAADSRSSVYLQPVADRQGRTSHSGLERRAYHGGYLQLQFRALSQKSRRKNARSGKHL